MGKTAKAILFLLICMVCFGCDNSYDGLKVKDGNDRIFILKHRMGDLYFVNNLSEEPPTPNSKINEKLK